MEPRRRAPRVPTEGWHGRSAVEGEAAPEWTECQVVDVSVIGAGVVLWAEDDPSLVGRSLVVEVSPPIAESVLLRLVGRVRWASRESTYHVRVGLEFENLSEIEQTIVKVIEKLQEDS